jgi:hypothetical protein
MPTTSVKHLKKQTVSLPLCAGWCLCRRLYRGNPVQFRAKTTLDALLLACGSIHHAVVMDACTPS